MTRDFTTVDKVVIGFASVALLAIAGIMFRAALSDVVRPGQVWVDESPDPFLPYRRTNVVLAVRNGFVQYQEGGHTYSLPVRLFVSGSNRQ